jgi:hypothetical protein
LGSLSIFSSASVQVLSKSLREFSGIKNTFQNWYRDSDYGRGPRPIGGTSRLIIKNCVQQGVRRFENGAYTVVREYFETAYNAAIGH